MDFKEFATSAAAEKDGVWKDIGKGARVKVARLGNNRYQSRFEALIKPHAFEMRRGTLDESIKDDIALTVLAETVLVDWEGFTEDGAPLPYSPSAAKSVMARYKDFRDLIVEFASQAANYREEAVKDAEKN